LEGENLYGTCFCHDPGSKPLAQRRHVYGVEYAAYLLETIKLSTARRAPCKMLLYLAPPLARKLSIHIGIKLGKDLFAAHLDLLSSWINERMGKNPRCQINYF
jgi:hypothetical protein